MNLIARLHHHRIRGALILAIWTGTAMGAGAQSVGPEIPVWIDSATSHNPRVAFNADNQEFLVVWSNTEDSETVTVTARRVSLDGSLETSFPIISVANQIHQYPALAYSSLHGTYLVAWEHWIPSTAGDWDTIGSMVSWDGSVVGSPFVVGSGFEAHIRPDVASNQNDNEYLVVSLDVGPGWRDVHARRLDGAGTQTGSAVITTSGDNGVGRPHVAFSPEIDAYFIGYSNESPSAGHRTAVGKIVAPDLAGASSALEIVVVDDPVDDVQFPVAGESATSFVSIYNLGLDTMAKRLMSDGSPTGPAAGIPLGLQDNQTIQYSTRPNAVARADAIGYVVVWHQLTPTTGNVYAQALSATSNHVVSNTFTLAGSSADEREVDVACAPWGDCLVVYQRDQNIVGRVLRLRVFADGFESGTTQAWTAP